MSNNSYIPNITIQIDGGCNTCKLPLNVAANQGGCGCTSALSVTQDTTPNSPCVDCIDPCGGEYTFTDCMLYSAGDIPQLGISNNDKLTKILISYAAEIIDLKRRLAAASIA